MFVKKTYFNRREQKTTFEGLRWKHWRVNHFQDLRLYFYWAHGTVISQCQNRLSFRSSKNPLTQYSGGTQTSVLHLLFLEQLVGNCF